MVSNHESELNTEINQQIEKDTPQNKKLIMIYLM